jgi:hypothetical protein
VNGLLALEVLPSVVHGDRTTLALTYLRRHSPRVDGYTYSLTLEIFSDRGSWGDKKLVRLDLVRGQSDRDGGGVRAERPRRTRVWGLWQVAGRRAVAALFGISVQQFANKYAKKVFSRNVGRRSNDCLLTLLLKLHHVCYSYNRKTECWEHSAYTTGLDGMSLQVAGTCKTHLRRST